MARRARREHRASRHLEVRLAVLSSSVERLGEADRHRRAGERTEREDRGRGRGEAPIGGQLRGHEQEEQPDRREQKGPGDDRHDPERRRHDREGGADRVALHGRGLYRVVTTRGQPDFRRRPL